MEKRAILAAVLMAVLLIAYQTFFLGPSEVQQKAPPSEAPGARSLVARWWSRLRRPPRS